MNYRTKKHATLLCLALMLSGCASTSTRWTPVEPARVPNPPAQLMAPLPASPVNVDQLLQRWTSMLEAWRKQQQVCKDTPQKCV